MAGYDTILGLGPIEVSSDYWYSGPGVSHAMPYYYNALGEKQVNYAYVQGPHSGVVCNCGECAAFNEQFQNRAVQQKIMEEIHYDAMDIMRSCGVNPTMSLDGRVDINTVISMMRQFACKHISKYQGEMVKKVHQIQVTHTAQIAAMQHKLTERRIDLPVHQNREGRLFRDGEKSEAA